MRDKFIDINTLEGDKLVVSLCCNYPFIKEALPADYKYLDIIEISIDRMEGNNPIVPKTFSVSIQYFFVTNLFFILTLLICTSPCHYTTNSRSNYYN